MLKPGLSYMEKCYSMYNGKLVIRLQSCKCSLLLSNTTLAVVDEVKDLGVNINSRLTFLTQIKETIVLACVRTNLIQKCLTSLDV